MAKFALKDPRPLKGEGRYTGDSGDFRMMLDTALRRMDFAGFASRRAEAAKRGRRRGIGLSYYLEATDGDPIDTPATPEKLWQALLRDA